SVVLLVELAALPIGHDKSSTTGPVHWELVGIVWGTTIGLTMAHWFAFSVATNGLRLTNLPEHSRDEIRGELVAAAFVATVCSIPVLILPSEIAQEMLGYVLAAIIGGTAFIVERANGRSRAFSLLYAAGALLLGLVVATLKYLLAFH